MSNWLEKPDAPEKITDKTIWKIIGTIVFLAGAVLGGHYLLSEYQQFRNRNLRTGVQEQVRDENFKYLIARIETVLQRMSTILDEEWRLCDLPENESEIEISDQRFELESNLVGEGIEPKRTPNPDDPKILKLKSLGHSGIFYDEKNDYSLVYASALNNQREGFEETAPDRRCWARQEMDFYDEKCELNTRYLLVKIKRDEEGNIIGLEVRIAYPKGRNKIELSKQDFSKHISPEDIRRFIETFQKYLAEKEKFKKTMEETKRKCKAVANIRAAESARLAEEKASSPELIKKLKMCTVRISYDGKRFNGTIVGKNRILSAGHGFTSEDSRSQFCHESEGYREIEIDHVNETAKIKKDTAKARFSCSKGNDTVNILLEKDLFSDEQIAQKGIGLNRSDTFFIPNTSFLSHPGNSSLRAVRGSMMYTQDTALPIRRFPVECYDEVKLSPGDSGTGIFDTDGRVVGCVSTATYQQEQGISNTCFASF